MQWHPQDGSPGLCHQSLCGEGMGPWPQVSASSSTTAFMASSDEDMQCKYFLPLGGHALSVPAVGRLFGRFSGGFRSTGRRTGLGVAGFSIGASTGCNLVQRPGRTDLSSRRLNFKRFALARSASASRALSSTTRARQDSSSSWSLASSSCKRAMASSLL